jgi:GMP synthase (glutamine-hydrolysing)
MKQVNVIRHLAFEDMGCFADVLAERGIQLRYYDAPTADLGALEADSDEPLVVLGGPISVNDTADYAFLGTELALLEQRLALDRPTLGICLGAQLMAKALGAKVYPGPEKEIGWFPLRLSEAGHGSMLEVLAQEGVRMLHWHGETFDLPEGAVHLAASDQYRNQAFSYGRHCIALQFHAECTVKGLESWYVGHVGEISQHKDISVNVLRNDAQRYASEAASRGASFFGAWLDRC